MTKQLSLDEVQAIVMAEWTRWRIADDDSETSSLICMGAMGAAANILCEVMGLDLSATRMAESCHPPENNHESRCDG